MLCLKTLSDTLKEEVLSSKIERVGGCPRRSEAVLSGDLCDRAPETSCVKQHMNFWPTSNGWSRAMLSDDSEL